jgi:hypothetical protein
VGSLGSRPTQGGGWCSGRGHGSAAGPPGRAVASAGTRSGKGIPRGQPEFSIEHPGKYERTTSGVSEIVNSDTGRQPSGAALPCEGELSRLRSGGTPASLLSSRHLSCRSIRGPGLLDERAEDLPH